MTGVSWHLFALIVLLGFVGFVVLSVLAWWLLDDDDDDVDDDEAWWL